jgi:hypothetical protein
MVMVRVKGNNPMQIPNKLAQSGREKFRERNMQTSASVNRAVAGMAK